MKSPEDIDDIILIDDDEIETIMTGGKKAGKKSAKKMPPMSGKNIENTINKMVSSPLFFSDDDEGGENESEFDGFLEGGEKNKTPQAMEQEMSVFRKEMYGFLKQVDASVLPDADNRYESFRLASLQPHELRLNVNTVSAVFEVLDKSDVWYKRSSPCFRALKDTLKELKKLSKDLAKLPVDDTKQAVDKREAVLSQYQLCAQTALRLSKEYLEKKVPNGEYARKRVEAVSQLKDILTQHIDSCKKAQQEEKELEAERNAYEKNRLSDLEKEKVLMQKSLEDQEKYSMMNPGPDGNRKAFLGDLDHRSAERSGLSGIYSVTRSADYTAALMLMLAEEEKGKPKYSLDDLLDGSKLKKEKNSYYKIVCPHFKSDDMAWLSNVYYQGVKKGKERIKELLGKVDFNDKNYIYDVNFRKACVLGDYMYDAFQELKRDEERSVDLIKRDYPGSKKSYEQMEIDYRTAISTLPSFLIEVDKRSKAVLDPDDPEQNGLIRSSYCVHEYRGRVADICTKNLKLGRPIDMWFNPDEKNYVKDMSSVMEDKALNMNLDTQAQYIPEMINGRLFSGIKPVWRSTEPGREPVPYMDYLDGLSGTLNGGLLDKRVAENSRSIASIYKAADIQVKKFTQLKKTSPKEMQRYIDGAFDAYKDMGLLAAKGGKMNASEQKKAGAGIEKILAYHVADQLYQLGVRGDQLHKTVKDTCTFVSSLSEYKEYLRVGSLTSFLELDVAGKVASDRKFSELKGSIADQGLKIGLYQKDREVINAYAHALAYKYMKHAKSLPVNPATGKKYTDMNEFVESVVQNPKKHLLKEHIKGFKRPDSATYKSILEDNAFKEKLHAANRQMKKSGNQKGK